MYKNFVEFMKDFLDEDSSQDFWYDIASEDARKLLLRFSESDWLEMLNELDFQPLEFKKKLAYCLDNIESAQQLKVLLQLANTQDKELFEVCVDSLRNFMDNDRDEILQNKLLINNIKQMLPDVGIATKKVYEDFLYKLERD